MLYDQLNIKLKNQIKSDFLVLGLFIFAIPFSISIAPK